MRRLLLGLLFPWLLSCNERVICYEYALQGRYETWEKKEVSDAFAHWNAFAGKRVLTLREAGHAQCEIHRLATKEDAVAMDEKYGSREGGTVRGVYMGDSGDILIYPPDLRIGESRGVIMHELGHGLDLDHVRYGVMSAQIVTNIFTQDDHDECVRVGVCTVEWPLAYPPQGAVKQEPW